MSHTVRVTQTSTYEAGGASTARDALNQRRLRLRAAKIPHTVDDLTLKFIDPYDGATIALEYRDLP